MSIQLVTYANQTVTPTNDAIIYERAIDQNGIFYGCNVTVSSNNVNITGGYGIVCGREFVIQSEAIAVTLAPSGTLDGRLYVRLDLADADAPIQLLTATGNTLPPLEHDADVNYTNGTYEMELATFTVGVSALSDVVETFETIVGSKQYTDTQFSTSGVVNLSTSSLNHLASASATLSYFGKSGLLAVTAKNTSSALAAGSDASFTITDLPPLAVSSRGCGFSGTTCMVANVLQGTGVVTMRAIASQWGASYDVYITIPIILE